MRYRRAMPALLVLPVLLAHIWLGVAVQGLQEGWGGAAVPPRLTVAYVRELIAQPPPTPAPRLKKLAAPAAAAAASLEPLVNPPEAAASAPENIEPLQALLPIVEPVAAALVNPPASDAGVEWPPSTRLSYELTGNYRGPVNGNAQVEWIRQASRYQVHLDVSVGPSFAPLITRHMSSDGELTAAGIVPKRYDEDTRVLLAARRRVSVLFQGDKLTLGNGSVEAAPPGSQDAASQFVQLSWLFATGREALRIGHVVELPLALPRKQYLWRYEVMGEELLQTPMGPLATWRLKPSTATSGDLSAEVWLAPSLQYLPVRLLIRQNEAAYIDLMLKAPPQQGAAETGPEVKPPAAPRNPPASDAEQTKL